MVICLERGADLHVAQLMPLLLTASCFSKIQIGFTFLVPAHLGSPGKRPLNSLFNKPSISSPGSGTGTGGTTRLRSEPEPEPLKNHRFRFRTDLAPLPPTQVSVERLFSAMKILLTDLRSKMKDDIVEAILFLKSNQCV